MRCVLIGCCLLAGCQQEMATQPSIRPDEVSTFYPDGRAARPIVPGVVARGHLHADRHLFAGLKTNQPLVPVQPAMGIAVAANPLAALVFFTPLDQYTDQFPFAMTEDALQHGKVRYMIYCAICHDSLGTGQGKVPERGYTPPPSLHIARLRAAPVGYVFDVITRGYGSMPSYRNQIPPRDRWAIVGYVRVLQLSQHFPEKDLSPDLLALWKKQKEDAQ